MEYLPPTNFPPTRLHRLYPACTLIEEHVMASKIGRQAVRPDVPPCFRPDAVPYIAAGCTSGRKVRPAGRNFCYGCTLRTYITFMGFTLICLISVQVFVGLAEIL